MVINNGYGAGLTQGLLRKGAAGPAESKPSNFLRSCVGRANLPLVGSLQHHCHLLPGATLLSSALQVIVPALWLLATGGFWFLASRDGTIGPCWPTLMDTGRRVKVWKRVDWFAEADRDSQNNRCSPFPIGIGFISKKEEFVITEQQNYRWTGLVPILQFLHQRTCSLTLTKFQLHCKFHLDKGYIFS